MQTGTKDSWGGYMNIRKDILEEKIMWKDITLHNDKKVNPSKRYNNYKYM